ncbi:MAG: hypothetical protein LH479_07510 [Polaromonas sp.]|nr:hypothetical protein [Polaromonas sp.]
MTAAPPVRVSAPRPPGAFRPAFVIAASLLALPVFAQRPAPEPAAASALPPEPSRETARSIEFSSANIAAAFGFLDRDKDGRISRDEAAGIRGVARNFDRADLNHDGSLSRDEFEHAMKQSKTR